MMMMMMMHVDTQPEERMRKFQSKLNHWKLLIWTSIVPTNEVDTSVISLNLVGSDFSPTNVHRRPGTEPKI